jgi:hypothetical protein
VDVSFVEYTVNPAVGGFRENVFCPQFLNACYDLDLKYFLKTVCYRLVTSVVLLGGCGNFKRWA